MKSYFWGCFPVSRFSAIIVFVHKKPSQCERFDRSNNKIGSVLTQILTKIWKFIQPFSDIDLIWFCCYHWVLYCMVKVCLKCTSGYVCVLLNILYKECPDLDLWSYWSSMSAGFTVCDMQSVSGPISVVWLVGHGGILIHAWYIKCLCTYISGITGGPCW